MYCDLEIIPVCSMCIFDTKFVLENGPGIFGNQLHPTTSGYQVLDILKTDTYYCSLMIIVSI